MRCRYAENGFFIAPNGVVSPCCSISTGEWTSELISVDQFHTESKILDIRRSSKENNILNHPACKNCLKKEKLGQRSMRKVAEKVISYTSLKTTGDRLKRLDISFSNTCNLDCVMCRPEYSSKWIQLLEKMPDDLKIKTYRNNIKNHYLTYEQIDEIIDKVGKTLESVSIKGGEPLYDKRAIYFLKKLVDVNPYTKVSFTSNCTVIDFDLLSKFKDIHITASVDGIHEIYEYIRGTNFATVSSNIKKLSQMDNVSVKIAYTASVFNFEIFPQSVKYWENIGIKNIGIDFVMEPWISPHLVGGKKFKRVQKQTHYLKNWKFLQISDKDYKLHEEYKQFWNSHRKMDWDSIDVSKY